MSDDQFQPIAAFIREHDLQMSVRRASSKRGFFAGEPGDARYLVTIATPAGTKMTVPFSMGPGWGNTEPALTDVLDCLASDAAGYENAHDFDDWMDEYAYTDRPTAKRIYAAVTRSRTALMALLGDEGYEQLLWHTARE